jgi:hypothetical protein
MAPILALEGVMELPAAVEALRERWNRFADEALKPLLCAHCGGARVRWDGWRRRTASVLHDGAVHHLTGVRCRRVDCGACGRSWTLRPPGLAPRRHHQRDVVASATSRYLFAPRATRDSVAEAHGCSRRTLGRWLCWLAGLAALSDLQRHVLEAAGEVILPPFRSVADLARKAPLVGRAVLERAAQVLTLVEQLGSAWSLQAPALGPVLERVTGPGDTSTDARPCVPEFARRRLGRPFATLPG